MEIDIIYLTLSFLIGGLLTLLTFPTVLQLQVCEYLLYRLLDVVKEKGVIKTLLFPKFAFPAKSLRNLLILGISFILISTAVYLGVSTLIADSIVYIFLVLPLFIFIIRLSPVLSTIVTEPMAFIARYRFRYIAQRQIRNSKVKIIAITGSYGKSSVKEYLHRIMSTKYRVGKSRWNRNTGVGIAMEIGLQVTPYTEYFIAEMGAYRVGDIRAMCKEFKPVIGVVTAIGNQHLSLFGSREKIAKGKLEMVSGASSDVFISLDWENSEDTLNKFVDVTDSNRVITYSLSNPNAMYYIKNYSNLNGFQDFILEIDGKQESYRTKLLGSHSVLNLIPAIVISRRLGVEYEKVYEVVSSLEQVVGKLSLHNYSDGSLTVINDSYNSNVNGFVEGIKVLQGYGDVKSKRYVSSLGLFELGDEKVVSYTRVLDELKDSNITLLTTSVDFKDLANDSQRIKLFQSESEILNFVKSLEPRSVLLIEGRHSPTFTSSLGLSKAY